MSEGGGDGVVVSQSRVHFKSATSVSRAAATSTANTSTPTGGECIGCCRGVGLEHHANAANTVSSNAEKCRASQCMASPQSLGYK